MTDPSSRLSLMAVVGAIVVAVVAGIYLARDPEPIPSSAPREPEPVGPSAVVAHVSGAVRDPGLVSLSEPARIADAVEAAGGATSGADLAAINLADPVRDGDHIVIPAIGGEVGGGEDGIDLNRSSAGELSSLHGIGPVLAERIVAYRAEHGPFESVEDLLDVPGIGEAKLALLRSGVSKP